MTAEHARELIELHFKNLNSKLIQDYKYEFSEIELAAASGATGIKMNLKEYTNSSRLEFERLLCRLGYKITPVYYDPNEIVISW